MTRSRDIPVVPNTRPPVKITSPDHKHTGPVELRPGPCIPSESHYLSITPEPTSSSPSYHAANCPGAIPRWGSSKRI